jgi:hypothetical protein
MAQAKEVKKEEKMTPAKLRYMRDKDREIVKGIFRFYEVPGGSLSFYFRKYKEDNVERFDMIDGMTYSVPLGVAKHLNTSGSYPVHAYQTDERGIPHMHIGKRVRRYGFQSLEFIDIDDLSEIGSPEMPGESPIISQH